MFWFKFSPYDIHVTGFVTSCAYHQPNQFIKLYQSTAFVALQVEMKGWVAFHKIPEVLSLMTWFQGRLIMKDKAGGHPGTMKTFFHYNQTTGDVNHFPQV